MAADSSASHELPIIAESAPLLTLIAAEGSGQRRIPCRRAVALIGSKEGCKVRLKHPRICPVHAAIVQTGSAAYALDLMSRKGTLLNHLKLRNEQLRDGDVLSVGPWSFGVEVIAPALDSSRVDLLEVDSAPVGVVLEIGEDQRFEPPHPVCLIGRQAGCDLVLTDPSVSRAHAVLLMSHGRPAICDLLSTNGLSVNDRPVTFHFLSDGDVLTFGATQAVARIVAPKPDSGPPVNGKAAGPTPAPLAPPAGDDLVNIRDTEGTSRWEIVDHLERAKRKR